jgi:translation initiation factor IF-1
MRPEPEQPIDRLATDRPTAALRATVVTSLVNGLFRLQLADGREVVAHAALELRKAFTRLLPGDPVLVELSPFDPDRARICRLIRSPRHSEQPTPPHRDSKPPMSHWQPQLPNLLNGELS